MNARNILLSIVEDNPTALKEHFTGAIMGKLEYLIEREKNHVGTSLFMEGDGEGDGGDGGADIDWDDLDDLPEDDDAIDDDGEGEEGDEEGEEEVPSPFKTDLGA